MNVTTIKAERFEGSNKEKLLIYSIIKKKGNEQLASVQKIVDKMKRQPNGIKPEEADRVLQEYE